MHKDPRRIAALALAMTILLPAMHVAALDADRFAVPPAAQVAADAQLTVVDQPAAPPFDPDSVFDPNTVLQALTDRLAGFPADAWDVTALATTFGGDPVRAFEFVRDSIGLDPYRGVLRGAQGTLAARAGSDADRALLLSTLLGEMGFTTRFAFADLDDAAAKGLVERSLVPAAHPVAGADASEVIDAELLDAIAVRARRDHARLLGALGDRSGGLGTAPGRDAAADLVHHVWVQLERDGAWVDLDPTMPDAQEGQPLVPATTTADAIPDPEHASVTVRVLAENLVDGVIQESIPLDQRLDAAAATTATVLLTFVPEGGGGGLLDIGASGGPPSAYQPVLMVDGVATTGEPVGVLGSTDDFFGTGSDVRLTRLAIELTSDAPGRDPVTRERVLLDRVPPEARATGSWTADDLGPMPVVDDLPAVMLGVHHVMVSTGGSDPVGALEGSIAGTLVAADDLASDDAPDKVTLGTVMLPQTSFDAQLVLASEHGIVAGLDGSGADRAFVGRPRVFLVSLAPDPNAPEAISVTTDLALDGVDIVGPAIDDPTADAARRMWYGAAETALETEFGLRVARSGDPDGRQLAGVSLAMSDPLSVLTASSGTAGAPEALVQALDDGWIVVVPGDVTTAGSWWAISPLDGETRSLLPTGGLAFESAFFPLHWGKSWDPLSQEWVDWYEKTKIRRRCGGGNEYGELQDCVVRPTTQQLTLLYVKLMRQYAQYLVLVP